MPRGEKILEFWDFGRHRISGYELKLIRHPDISSEGANAKEAQWHG